MSEWRCGPGCPFWTRMGWYKPVCLLSGRMSDDGEECDFDLEDWERRVGTLTAAIAARKEKEAQTDA